MRKSDIYFLAVLTGVGMIGVLAGIETTRGEGVAGRIAHERRLVRKLGLTDLCLCTEARFTRHPTQADRHAAFQEAPGAMDLFPSGSLIGPPVFLERSGEAK